MEVLLKLCFINFLVVAVMMVLVWMASLRLKNAGIIDIFWGIGFVLIGWATFFQADGYYVRKLMLLTMPTLWGLRLAIHIFVRNPGQPEDRRYVAIRKNLGPGFWWKSLIYIFGLQKVLLWIISIPVQLIPAPDINGAEVVTVIGRAAVAGNDEKEMLVQKYVNKHPYLEQFIKSTGCRLIKIKVRTYVFVENFQQSHILKMN